MLPRVSFWRSIALIALFGSSACFGGEVEAPDVACSTCHGSATSAAPPGALGGFTAIEYLGVGAHTAHLTGPTLGRPIDCQECHTLPATIDAPGHIDDDWPAEMKWGPLSKTGSTSPSWDRAAGTCSNMYCHGATLRGGVSTVPVWTTVDGTQLLCTSCHGAPPPAPHPPSAACENCHGPTAGAGLTIANPATHIDGKLQL